MNITGSGQSAELLFELVGVLNERGIDYVVIGALAVSVHGVVRASMDADALVSAAFGELKSLADDLAARSYKVELRRGDPDDPIAAMLVVEDQYQNRVDLLMGLRGLDAEVYKRAVEIHLPTHACALRVASREDIIAMKCFAGGPLDLLDAERLVAVAGGLLDKELLDRLAKHFGKDAVANCDRLIGALTIR